MNKSWSLAVAVWPSLKPKSAKSPFSPPFMGTTPFSSTLTFFPPASASLEISGRDSPFEAFWSDFYK